MSGLFLLLALVAMGYTAMGNQSHGTNYTKNSFAILLFLVGSILHTLAYSGIVPTATQAFAVPFAFCATTFFYDEKKKEWIWNILLVLLLTAAAVYNLLV